MEKQAGHKLEAEHWNYLGEGNEHMILSYHGKDLNLLFRALHLVKEYTEVNTEAPSKTELEEFVDEKLPQYVKDIIYSGYEPARRYINFTTPVTVENYHEFVQKISVKVQDIRPDMRKIKGISKSGENFVTISRNLSSAQTHPDYDSYAVEIKPKSFLHEAHLESQYDAILEKMKLPLTFKDVVTKSQQANPIERTKFYKVQLQKILEKKVAEHSKYNPIEFFGSEEERRRAIFSLIETPQNNLQISLNGKKMKVLDPSLKELQRLGEIVLQVLKKENGILEFIKAMQNLSTHKTYEVLEALKRFESETHTKDELSVLLKDSCEKILEILKTGKEPTSPALNENFLTVIRFLISATYRDLSMMISIQIPKEGKTGIRKEDSNGAWKGWNTLEGNIYFRIALIDVEPKNFKKPEGFYVQENEILETYLNYLAQQNNK